MCNSEEELNEADDFYDRAIDSGYKKAFVHQIIRVHLRHCWDIRQGKHRNQLESDLQNMLGCPGEDFDYYMASLAKKYKTADPNYKSPDGLDIDWNHGWRFNRKQQIWNGDLNDR